MGPGWRPLIAAGLVAAAFGADVEPTTRSSAWAARELPPDVCAALDRIQDFTFNFDQPGFYAVVESVAHGTLSPGHTEPPIEIEDWRDLLERPTDLRGRAVTVDGVIGRGKDPYRLNQRPDLGLLSQIELARPDQPLSCTLIFTQSVADLPLGATIRVTGYFVMIRQYHGPSGRAQQAALIVAPGPTSITRAGGRPATSPELDWRWMLAAVALGALLTLILLRRTAGQRRREAHTLRSTAPAPLNLAHDLQDWAANEHPPERRTPARDRESNMP